MVLSSALDLEGDLAVISIDASSDLVVASKVLKHFDVRDMRLCGRSYWFGSTYSLLKEGITGQVTINGGVVLGAFNRPPLSSLAIFRGS